MRRGNGLPIVRAAAQARRWRDSDGEHIDVRGLPPPEPLVEILQLVGSIADGSIADCSAVIVHHDREPVLLYPELAQIGWQAERLAGEPDEVRLRLERCA